MYLIIIMIGIYIVANPSFGSFNIGDLLSLISALFASLSILSLTQSRKENPAYMIVFYVMLFGTIINIPTAFKDLSSFDMNGLVPVIVSASFGVLGQIFITWGYKYVDSATGSLISASRIIMAALIGYMFLGEPINLRILMGIILITLSLIGISGYFNKKSKA
ncbi:MAG: DMT family transporter [Tissierellia bacterium]|nr:DMT family transporter [Tissierellia bacterium]